MTFQLQTYTPAGQTVSRFHASAAFVRLMAGPIGSGKTTGGCWEAPFTAMMQRPDPDGVRRAQVGMLRDTYRNLYATTLRTWFKFFPREVGHFTGSDDRPFMHTLSFPAPLLGRDGQPTREMGMCELEVEGRALGTHSVEATCRGWEKVLTIVDEIDLCPRETIPFLVGRTMRGGDKRTRYSRGVVGIFNKPDVDHWTHEICIDDPMEGMEFFDQPGGLLPGMPYRTNPAAENLANLDEGYYIKAATGSPDWYVTRMLRNEWGASISGERIWPEFRADLHMSPFEMEPAPHSVLKLGVDGGGTPAAVVGGRDTLGRRIIYAEVVLVDPSDPRGRKLLHGAGPKRFAAAVRDTLYPRFQNCLVEVAYADPSMFYGADREMGEYADIETIGQLLEIPVQPAPSNEVSLRVEGVSSLLTTLSQDGRPNLLINPSCKWTRRGCSSDYKWEERDPKQPGKRLRPQKTATSHVCEALQYYALGDIGRAGVTAGARYDLFQPSRLPGGVPRPAAENAFAMPGLNRGASGFGDSYSQDAPGQSYQTKFNPWD